MQYGKNIRQTTLLPCSKPIMDSDFTQSKMQIVTWDCKESDTTEQLNSNEVLHVSGLHFSLTTSLSSFFFSLVSCFSNTSGMFLHFFFLILCTYLHFFTPQIWGRGSQFSASLPGRENWDAPLPDICLANSLPSNFAQSICFPEDIYSDHAI